MENKAIVLVIDGQSIIITSDELPISSEKFLIFNKEENRLDDLNKDIANEQQSAIAVELLNWAHPVWTFVKMVSKITFDKKGLKVDIRRELGIINLNFYKKEIEESIKSILEKVFKVNITIN